LPYILEAPQGPLYPENFFCGHCNDWERDNSTLSKKAKRTSHQFCCEAMHFSALMPTQLKKAYHPSMQVWQDEQERRERHEEYFWSDEGLRDIDKDKDLSDIDEDDDCDMTEDPEPANDKTEERRHLLETTKAVECELLQQVGQARRDEQAKSKEQTTELETHVQRLQEKVELLTKSLVSAQQNVDRLRHRLHHRLRHRLHHRLRHLQPEKEHPNPNAKMARGCALENTIAKAIAGACHSSREGFAKETREGNCERCFQCDGWGCRG
jgi:chromosome segregation ATPase